MGFPMVRCDAMNCSPQQRGVLQLHAAACSAPCSLPGSVNSVQDVLGHMSSRQAPDVKAEIMNAILGLSCSCLKNWIHGKLPLPHGDAHLQFQSSHPLLLRRRCLPPFLAGYLRAGSRSPTPPSSSRASISQAWWGWGSSCAPWSPT